ncbi:MAG: DNA-3-methyladenine glycosylase [Acidobacteriota bacterium]|nr:DNA-3-methyladenine glycosylase [Acidobacteriota bacterium]
MRKAINHLKKADPVMAAIIAKAGPYRVGFTDPVFQTLVRSIVYQQLSGKAARTIFNRLVEAVKVNPMTPQAVLKLRPEKMRAVGLSQQKTLYIRELARFTRDGKIQFERLPEMADAAIIETLTRVKGVGVWTVQMFLMFALQRPNVLPVGDLGVRAAMKKAYGLAELPKPQEMERIAEAWHPYRSVASWYLWRSLE